MARNNEQNEQTRALSTEVLPPRLPYPAQIEAAGISAGQWKALTDAIFPSAKTVDGVVLALEYAKARRLDVFKRVIHVVPMWNSALGREVETVWPGIGELRTTAHRTGKMAGIDNCVFGPEKSHKFQDQREREGRSGKYVQREECELTFPEWAQVTVYRMVDGQRCAFVGPKVRFKETFSGIAGLQVPNARWQRAPYQMLEKCAEAAALRRAFPEELGDEATAEEMEGRDMMGAGAIDVDFAVVPEADEGAQQRQGRPTRGGGGTKENTEAEKRGWSDAIDAEMKNIQSKLDRTMTPAPLPGARDSELERLKDWPKKALDKVRQMFDDRIAFLKGDEPEKTEGTSEGTTDGSSEATVDEHGGEDDSPYTDADYQRFVGQYINRLAEKIGNAPDLNSFQSGEKTALGQLPADYRAEADRAFALAMKITKDGGDADEFLVAVLASDDGAPAAGAGPSEQAEEAK